MWMVFKIQDGVDWLICISGTGLVILTSTESSDSSYYGEQGLHYISTNGDSCLVPLGVCVCVCVHFVDLALLLCPLNKALLGTRCFIGFVIEKLDLHVCYWCLKLCCCLKLSWLVWAILFISTAVERQTMQVSVGLHGCTICHFWFLLFCTAARNKLEADWLQGA